jgi:hypothetical protein
MRSLTTVRRGRAAITSLIAVAAATGLVAGPVAGAAQAQAPGQWSVRVLPSRDTNSQPSFLLDDGSVIGTDYATEAWGQGRPWIWTAATGRRQLGLAGATWAHVADAADAANIVGTLYRTDASGVPRSTAVRWVGTRPVPLLPDAPLDTVADSTSPNGDVFVRERTPSGETGWLLSPGQPPTDLQIFPTREASPSLNSARQVVTWTAGPGTIGPVSFNIWQNGTRQALGLAGIRDFPACVADITESGYVAGSQFVFGSNPIVREGVLWRDGVRTVLPTADGLGADVACTTNGVNEAGHVAGSLVRPIVRPGEPDPGAGTPRAVIWRDGAVQTLATDTAQQTVRSVALNERDAVLAQLGTPAGARTGAAVFAGGARRNLPVPAGLTDIVAADINEANQVIGSGVRTAADGTTRKVTLVWTPRTPV